MTADVDIIVVENENVLLLPIEAVKEERGLVAQLTVPTSQLTKLTRQATVELGLGTGKKFAGIVSQYKPGAERGNVQVTLTNVGRGVRPGRTSVTLTVGDSSIPNIPAMLRPGKQYHVMLVSPGKGSDGPTKGHTFRGSKKIVEVGEQNDTDIEILSGLREGDRVLVQTAGPAGGPAQRGRRRP